MRLTFQRQVLTGISFSILLVLAMGYVAYHALLVQQENAGWVAHTREVMRVSTSVKNRLLAAESNVRGFAITSNGSFETSYLQANNEIWSELDVMRKLVKDNPVQSVRIDSLSNLLETRLHLMGRQYQVIKNGNYDQEVVRDIVLKGKELSSQIEFSFKKIENTEEGLLTEREERASVSTSKAKLYILLGSSGFLLVIFLLYYFIRKTYNAQVTSEQETRLANNQLAELSRQDQQKNWILNAAIELSVAIRGEPTLNELSERLIRKVAELTGAHVAVMYLIARTGNVLEKSASYGTGSGVPDVVRFGEGMLGQIAADKTDLKQLDVAPAYLGVKSATGSADPAVVLVKSVVFEENITALIEIGYLNDPGEKVVKLLETVSDNVAVAIMASKARQTANELLEKTQLQAEELESQQEELRVTNEVLTHQTSLLQVSEE